MTVLATVHNATVLRRTFRRWIEILLNTDDAEDLTLAVYEALINAADHAYTGQATSGSIWLHATVADGQVLVTITDNGTWRTPDNPTRQRGRGLSLIHQLTDAHVTVEALGTTVHLRHQLRPQRAGRH